MGLFDKKTIEQHVQEMKEYFLKMIKVEEDIDMCLGLGALIVETQDIDLLISNLYELVSTEYNVLGQGPMADHLKKQQGRPIIIWDLKTFRKYDAEGSMHWLSKQPKEPRPIIVIKNITDIPCGDPNIYDNPEWVENILLHAWKNKVLHLNNRGTPFELDSDDYSVIFPILPGTLKLLAHSAKGEMGFIQIL